MLKLRRTQQGLIAHDASDDRWVAPPGEPDLIHLLADDEAGRARVADAIASAQESVSPDGALLPFAPRSMRAFMLC